VKLIKVAAGEFTFKLDRREQPVFLKILELYPLIPVAHHRLSKNTPQPEHQEWLEQTHAAQQQEHKNKIQTLLQNPAVLQAEETGHRLSLKTAQLEWLLQVINDVRVGSWLLLGSPENSAATLAALNEQNVLYFWALEMAGRFQMILLKALDGASPDAPPPTD